MGQFLVENLVLTLLGAVLGVVLAVAVMAALSNSALLPQVQLQLNVRVFLMGAALAVVFGVISGVYPGLAHVPPAPRGRAEGRGTMIAHLWKLIWNRKRANALILAELVAAFLVLAALATSVSYFVWNARQPLGLSSDGVWVAGVGHGIDRRLGNPPEKVAEAMTVTRQLLQVVRDLPEVESVAAALTGPFVSGMRNTQKSDGDEIPVLGRGLDVGHRPGHRRFHQGVRPAGGARALVRAAGRRPELLAGGDQREDGPRLLRRRRSRWGSRSGRPTTSRRGWWG